MASRRRKQERQLQVYNGAPLLHRRIVTCELDRLALDMKFPIDIHIHIYRRLSCEHVVTEFPLNTSEARDTPSKTWRTQLLQNSCCYYYYYYYYYYYSELFKNKHTFALKYVR